ncbi:MAG TPA: GNAT family N-acetyltransferase [Alphaproteobacteria bacterium]|nr:GNAT family N-acetyltransferase [Alphaproteobacteria bacterium]
MAIRTATAAEADTVRDLVHRAYQKYVAVLGRPPLPMTANYPALIEEGVVWVLTQDGAIVGVLVLLDRPDHLLLENVAVDPEHQRKGYGKILLAFAEREARERGHDQIRLYTNALMTGNIALYRSLGYRETHREGEDGFRRVFMTKPV